MIPSRPCRTSLEYCRPRTRREDFRQTTGRAAGGILLEAMVHLDHFQIKVRSKDFRRLFRKPEQRVDPDAEIWRENQRNRPADSADLFKLGIGMAGRADDQQLAGSRASLGNQRRDAMMGKLDDRIRRREAGSKSSPISTSATTRTIRVELRATR